MAHERPNAVNAVSVLGPDHSGGRRMRSQRLHVVKHIRPTSHPRIESATVVTGFHPGMTVSWDVADGPTSEALRELADSFAGAEAMMLLPIDSPQAEPAVVEARVDRFVPNPG
jgi:hypothetical protein